MSTGGVFQIITNNGVQDKIIMATDQLRENLKKISADRLAELKKVNMGKTDAEILNQNKDWMPSLASIEKSHILFVNATFKPYVALAHEYSKTVPRGGVAELGSTFSFSLPIMGEFVNDMVMYVKLTGLSSKNATDKVRYFEYLAHKLTSKVSFKIQNHEIDYYNSDAQNVHYQYKVAPGKEIGYLRNIGQEVPKLGYLTANPVVDEVREYRYFGDGPQTFKQKHTTVEMWIPMLFWFRDLKCSLPNFLLPQNQTDIEVTFERENNLIAYANYGGGGLYNVPVISECSLYVNHIFLLPEIINIFINKFGFQLIRVRRFHSEILEDSEKSVKLHQIKWPVECLYVGFRPRTNLQNSQKWHKNTFIQDQVVKQAVVTGGVNIQINDAVYFNEQHTVAKLELRAHDVVIYPSLQPEFYNNYIPYRYGEHQKTPKDLGWYMLNFNMYPGDYQPSGHINISTSRELYLNYTSAVDPATNQYIIRKNNPADLIVVAECINFLLFSGNTAVLRFST